MPVRNLFCSAHDPETTLEVCYSQDSGAIEVSIFDLTGQNSAGGYVLLGPEDVPALCAELVRVAALAQQASKGGGNGAG